jgi:hypothetical protein
MTECPICSALSDGICDDCLDAVMREAPPEVILSEEDLDRMALDLFGEQH